MDRVHVDNNIVSMLGPLGFCCRLSRCASLHMCLRMAYPTAQTHAEPPQYTQAHRSSRCGCTCFGTYIHIAMSNCISLYIALCAMRCVQAGFALHLKSNPCDVAMHEC